MNNIMQYGKAQGMYLVQRYLPHLRWFYSLEVIRTVEDWEKIKKQYGDFVVHRVDYPIGYAKTKRNAVDGTNGLAGSIPNLIAAVRAQSDDGVILLAQTNFEPPKRQDYLGGFNILIELGQTVTLELVGLAFDGHELTQGLACHERYCVDWDDIPFITSRASMVRRALTRDTVKLSDYRRQRDDRIDFLVKNNCCLYEEAKRAVPGTVVWLYDEAFEKLWRDVVCYLHDHQHALLASNMQTFAVQGNVVLIGGEIQIQPWEIFHSGRWA